MNHNETIIVVGVSYMGSVLMEHVVKKKETIMIISDEVEKTNPFVNPSRTMIIKACPVPKIPHNINFFPKISTHEKEQRKLRNKYQQKRR